jgi:polyisoprenoid-binding protein YceI
MRTLIVSLAALALSCAILAAPRQAQPGAAEIDTAHSTITIHVFKTGLFSALGHNHEISAPIESGNVRDKVQEKVQDNAQPPGNPSVELRVDARKLRVLDPDASADTRAQVQRTMLGPEVLDADRLPEIHFQSTAVEASGANHWTVRGNLDLHGQSHPVAVDVTLKDSTYRGSAAFKQTDFGIKPVSVAGGTVKIKDEVKIDFEISLMTRFSL